MPSDRRTVAIWRGWSKVTTKPWPFRQDRVHSLALFGRTLSGMSGRSLGVPLPIGGSDPWQAVSANPITETSCAFNMSEPDKRGPDQVMARRDIKLTQRFADGSGQNGVISLGFGFAAVAEE